MMKGVHCIRFGKSRSIPSLVLMFTLFVLAFTAVGCGSQYNYSESKDFTHLMSYVDLQRSQSKAAAQQIYDLNSAHDFDYCINNYYENAKLYYTTNVEGYFNDWLERLAQEAQNGQALNEASGDSDILTFALKANYAFTTWANQVQNAFSTYPSGYCAPPIEIYDAANVLYPSPLEGAVSGLGIPIAIYTTNTFLGTDAQFDEWARAQETSNAMIVIAIKHNLTGNYSVTIVGGADLTLSESVYQTAQTAFVTTFESSSSSNPINATVTDATVAAINSLHNSIQQTSKVPSSTGLANSRGGYLQAMLPKEELPPEAAEEVDKISIEDITNAMNLLTSALGLVQTEASNSSSNNDQAVANDIESYRWEDFNCYQASSSNCS